jgi:hypothetical protein
MPRRPNASPLACTRNVLSSARSRAFPPYGDFSGSWETGSRVLDESWEAWGTRGGAQFRTRTRTRRSPNLPRLRDLKPVD